MAGRHKGHPKTGGRKAGVPNKRDVALFAKLKEGQLDPFEILLAFATNDWKALGYESEVYHKENADGSTSMGFIIPPDLRARTAKDACEYLWPKKSTVTLSLEKLTDDELFGEAERRINKEEEEALDDKE